MDLTTGFTEDFLTCSICCKVYTKPMCLPCYHVFCESCLQMLIRKSIIEDKKLLCPICKKTFNSEPKFEYDHTRMNLIEELSVKEKLLCSFCQLRSEQKEVVSKCLTCNELLCDVCSSSRHTFTTLTANHKVVSYKDFLEGKYELESTNIVCKRHLAMNIEFYCQVCRIPFCKDCLYLEHRGHDYVNISQVKIEIEKEAEEVLENLKETSNAIQQRQSALESIEQEIFENEKASLQKVGVAFDYFLDRLVVQRKIAEHEIKEKTEQEKQKIEALIRQNFKTTEKLKGLISFKEKLLSCKSDSKIAILRPGVRNSGSFGMVEKPSSTELCVSLTDFKMGNAKEFNAFDLKKVEVYRQVGPDGLLTERCNADSTENSLFQPCLHDNKEVSQVKEEVLVFAQTPVPTKVEHEPNNEKLVSTRKHEKSFHQKTIDIDLELKNREQDESKNKNIDCGQNETSENTSCSADLYAGTSMEQNENTSDSVDSDATTSMEQKQSEQTPQRTVVIDIYGKGKKPPTTKYTDVTWIDQSTYLVADEENENVIIVKLAGEDVERRLIHVKNAVTVAKFGGYLAVKTLMKQVNIFTYPELKLSKTCDEVSAIAAHSSNLILVTKSHIEIHVSNKLAVGKKISFQEKGNAFKFKNVFAACYLSNKTFAVTDAIDRCLRFIDSDGNIHAKVSYLKSGSYGVIACDENNLVYLASYNNDLVKVYNTNAMCVRRISLGGVLCTRSLSVLSENQILIATPDMVRLYNLENVHE